MRAHTALGEIKIHLVLPGRDYEPKQCYGSIGRFWPKKVVILSTDGPSISIRGCLLSFLVPINFGNRNKPL